MPSQLFIGIGCKRETSADAIKAAVTEVLKNAQLAVLDFLLKKIKHTCIIK